MTQDGEEMVARDSEWPGWGLLGRLNVRDAIDQSYSRFLSYFGNRKKFPLTYHTELGDDRCSDAK
jgi:hypothetical protein